MVTGESSRPDSAEQRLKELGIKLPAPPEPFGTYAEAVQTGSLLFLTGMLPTEGRGAKFVGRVGRSWTQRPDERRHLGSLDKVTRILRLGVSVATVGDLRDQPKVADARRSCCKTCLEKTRTRAGWFMALRAFRWAHQWSWN